jgi:Flp pilus assembly protein TadD
MKITSKLVTTSLGLIFMGSSVFAQSLPDAKKAIDAEQYQKAKSMLKNLTVTQPTKDENFFYLGWVYLKQDYTDSAKVAFNQGLAANPKSALNVAGFGAIDLLDNNTSSASANFDKAMLLAGKDTKPYVYIGKAYLLGKKPIAAARSTAAIAVLEKAKTLGGKNPSKDTELFLTLGDAYSASGDANHAYTSYADAQTLDPHSPVVLVSMAVLIKGAGNFEDAIKGFQGAIAADPNYGPAYREMAETDLLIAADPKQTAAKDKEAVDYYKKYLDLTDRSVESRFRYEDFLVYAKDWKTLEQEASDLAKSSKSPDLRVYRYLGYAAYENGNYPAGTDALNKWLKDASPKRIIPSDYVYLGRLQLKTAGQDSLGILNLRKAIALDTTQSDIYGEIAKAYYAKGKYKQAGDAYSDYINKSKNHKLSDYLNLGRSYFYAFSDQQDAYAKTKKDAPDTSLLIKADSALSYVNHHAASPVALVTITRARIADAREPEDRSKFKAYAKPFYEEYITQVGSLTDAASKKGLLEAYIYLGFYYELTAKDEAKASEYWGKAKEIDPANKQVMQYYSRHGGPPAPPSTPSKGK